MIDRPPRHPALEGLVQRVWVSSPTSAAPFELQLPTGQVSIAIRACGTPIEIDGVRRGTALVGGPRVRPYRKANVARTRSIGALLAPGAAQVLLGVPARELHGRHVELADLGFAQSIQAQLAERSDTDALSLLEATLAQRIAGLTDPLALTIRLRLGGGESLHQAAYALQISTRQARTRFWAAFGLSPRDASRLDRLQRLVYAIDAQPEDSWSERAYRHGYCDQAHLCRDFKALTGLVPTEYRPEPGRPNHVPLPNRPSRACATG